MKMATENIKGEQQRRLEARKNYIEQHLKPLEVNSLSDGSYSSAVSFRSVIFSFSAQLKSLCQELHNQLKATEESRYDLEFKIRKQDYDVRTQLVFISGFFFTTLCLVDQ